MEKNSKSNYYFIIFAVIVIVGVLAYNKDSHKPYEVITPDVSAYPEGTTVSLYKNIPEAFPRGVIVDNIIPDNIDEVKTKEGKTQLSMSYTSDMPQGEVATKYQDSLLKIGWRVSNKSTSANSSVFLATKIGQGEVLITMSNLSANKTLVSFQYEY